MSELKINNQAVQGQVIQVRAGAEGKALSQMTRDGVDNVAFKIEGDTFIASAKDLDLPEGVKEWTPVSYGGKSGHVLKVDSEKTSGKDIRNWGLGGAVIGLLGMPATAMAVGALFGGGALLPLGEMAIMAGAGAGIFGAIGAGWAAARRWYNGVEAGRDRLAKYAVKR